MCYNCDVILTKKLNGDPNLELGSIVTLTYPEGKVQNQQAFSVIRIDENHIFHLRLQK